MKPARSASDRVAFAVVVLASAWFAFTAAWGLFSIPGGGHLGGGVWGADSERFLRALHDRCWLAGLGWMMVSASGALLERSIVDRMVGGAERLVLIGPLPSSG